MRRADNLTTFMCRLSKSHGSLNLLQHSELIQASTGIALRSLYIYIYIWKYNNWQKVFFSPSLCQHPDTVTNSTKIQHHPHLPPPVQSTEFQSSQKRAKKTQKEQCFVLGHEGAAELWVWGSELARVSWKSEHEFERKRCTVQRDAKLSRNAVLYNVTPSCRQETLYCTT